MTLASKEDPDSASCSSAGLHREAVRSGAIAADILHSRGESLRLELIQKDGETYRSRAAKLIPGCLSVSQHVSSLREASCSHVLNHTVLLPVQRQ